MKENDFSLAPGKYVGFVIEIDHNFDYKLNLSKLQNELIKLSEENSEIINQIKKAKYEILGRSSNPWLVLEKIIGGGTPSMQNPDYWDGEIFGVL